MHSPAHAQSFEVFASNNPPFNYQAEDGEIGGIAVDVLKILMERVYQPIDPADISIMNWARAVEYTTTSPGKILLSPARTRKREALFGWVGPLHSFKMGLIARKRANISINTPQDLKNYRIGVIRGSASIHVLEKLAGIAPEQLVELSNDEQLFLMLERGRVDLVPRSVMSASFLLERLDLNPNEYEMVHVLKELDLYIGFSPTTDPDLLHRLNNELTRLKKDRPDGINEYDDIVHRHVHGKPIGIRSD